MATLDTLWPELRQLCRDSKIEVHIKSPSRHLLLADAAGFQLIRVLLPVVCTLTLHNHADLLLLLLLLLLLAAVQR